LSSALVISTLLVGQIAFAASTHYSKVASPNLSSISANDWDTAACGTTTAGDITSWGTGDTLTLCSSTANGRTAVNITALSGNKVGGYNIVIDSGAPVALSGDTAFRENPIPNFFINSNINSGGSFQLNAHSLTAGNITISGGTFDATNATLVIYGNLTHSGGTFITTGGSTVKLSDDNHTLSGAALNNLQWVSALTAPRTITINGAITIGGTFGGTFNLDGTATNKVSFIGTGSVSPAIVVNNCASSTVTGVTCASSGAVSAPIDFSFNHKPVESYSTDIELK
jgi:hypothetical protein